MDTRSLIALGMLLSLVAMALAKGAVQPQDVKEIVLFLGGGIIGFTVPKRTESEKASKPPTVPPAVVVLLAGSLLLLYGCATVEGEKRIPMGCADVLSQECDDPTAYPPLTAQLPRWPFPRLLPEQQPYAPPPPTPAGRLLEKLAR